MSRRVSLRFAVAPAVILLLGVVGKTLVQPSGSRPLRAPLAELPARLADYEMLGDETLSPAELRVLQPDDYVLRKYRNSSGGEATLFVAYYGRQLSGASVHSPRNCLPGSGWEPVEHERVTVRTPYGKSGVNRYVVEHKSGARALVFYWYQGRGRVAANEYAVKWDLLRDAVLKRRTDEALIRLVFPLRPGVEADPQLGVHLVEVVSRNLASYLPSGA